MAKVWRLYDGSDPTGGRGYWLELPLAEAKAEFDLRPEDFCAGPGSPPRFGDRVRDIWFGGYRHVVVEVLADEAEEAGWRPGYYRSRVKPMDAFDRLVRSPLAAALGADNVIRVTHEATTDSEGRDAVKITVVLAPEAIGRFRKGATLDALVRVQERLFDMRDERTPILHYATEAELAEHAGLEP